MPRKARIDALGALLHIIVLGIERGRRFSDDQDQDNFIERLADFISEMKTFFRLPLMYPTIEENH